MHLYKPDHIIVRIGPGPYLFLAVIIIVVALIIEYSERTQLKEQRELLIQLSQLDVADIRSVKIIPKSEPQFNDVCLTIEDRKSLAELAAFLRRADDTYYGGHQSPLFPFKLRFELVDGEETTYLVRNFERFPDDMYLNLYSYKFYPNGSYWYKGDPEVRIPGLYPWLKTKVAKAACSP